MNVAQFLVEIVRGLGVDTVFSLTGGMAMHINRAVAESGLSVVYCNHEQAVVAAADGYAKAMDYRVPGVAVVTSGPGVMNTVNSVASAYYDSVPVIVIAGQVKVADINTHGVRSFGAQETPHIDVLTPVTKLAFRHTPDDVSDEHLAACIAKCMSGRKGPIFIEVPLDIQPQTVVDPAERIKKIHLCIERLLSAPPPAPSAAVAAMRESLARCSRPAVVIGNGMHIAGISRETIRSLIEGLGMPALFTWPSTDLLEHSHDLHYGCAGGLAPTHANRIIQHADVLIFLGVRLDLLTTAFNPQNFGKHARRIVVDCDHNEIDKNQHLKNTSFFREDVGHVVAELSAQAFEAPCNSWPEWLDECRDWRNTDRRQEKIAFSGPTLTPYAMTRVLSEAKTVSYIVPTGSGYAVEGFARFVSPREGVTVSFAGHCLGSMGLALPMAIGAAAARRSTVVCLEGDGGILLNVQELYTLAANPHLQVVIVVMNNGGYQSIVRSQNRAFGKEFGASSKSGLCDVRFDLLATAVGFSYTRCETVADFEAAMMSGEGRRIIDVILIDDGYRGPAVTTKFDTNGKPYSTDIGDVTWDRSPS